MRKQSGAIVCPSCRRLIDVREPRCPNCGRPQPGLFGYGPALTRVLGAIDLVHLLAAACILLYLASILLDAESIRDVSVELARRGVFFYER